MKKIIAVLMFTLLAASVASAEVKMAYVDLNKALNESDAGKDAVKELESMIQKRQEKIKAKREEIKNLEEEIAKQSSILNDEALKEKRDKRDRLMKEYQRMVKDSEDELQKKRNDYMEKIIKQISKVVVQMGEEGGYTAIFEKAQSGLMYMPPSSDITDKVIERFNKTYRKK
jgi:outer membrane protein